MPLTPRTPERTLDPMRYFVLCYSNYEGVSPHIIAEVVHDAVDEDRTTTLASALAGDHAVIMTRAELLADSAGREALAAWEAGDDDEYDHETDALGLEGGAFVQPRRLRVVGENERLTRGVADDA